MDKNKIRKDIKESTAFYVDAQGCSHLCKTAKKEVMNFLEHDDWILRYKLKQTKHAGQWFVLY